MKWAALLALSIILSACAGSQSDHSGPTITAVTTSSQVLVISDCQSDSVTITARIRDESGIKQVRLWYRLGAEGPFTSMDMSLENGRYTATVKGSELLGQAYGNLEFYITAEDEGGNVSESQHDSSIQFLPCVSN